LPRLRVRLRPTAESIVRQGHPWVYSDSIRDQNRDGSAGELAIIYDRNDRFLAVGLFDPESPIRIRVLHVGKPVTLDSGWWRNRLLTASVQRKDLIGPETDGYRVINGESDGWPGLVLDRYGSTFVLKIYSAAWISRLRELALLVSVELGAVRVVLRLSRNIEVVAESLGLRDGQNLFGDDLSERVVFRESGLRFESEVVRGQKTGFFLDQRENRRIIESLASGREVLNAFSFSGGFSVYAARGGASRVTDLDISAHALASASRNFELNRDQFPPSHGGREEVLADAFQWLASVSRRQYGIVILDPPSLAKREAERFGAIEAYQRLISNGARLVERDGMLFAASCSAHVSDVEFFEAARAAVRASGRPATEWKLSGPAEDHPATIPEARYLKAIYFKFQ
jgi:23S rRNA (cytosine1962-C5)-methyltransferase